MGAGSGVGVLVGVFDGVGEDVGLASIPDFAVGVPSGNIGTAPTQDERRHAISAKKFVLILEVESKSFIIMNAFAKISTLVLG